MVYAGNLGAKPANSMCHVAVVFHPDSLPRWQVLLPGAGSTAGWLSSTGFFLLESVLAEVQHLSPIDIKSIFCPDPEQRWTLGEYRRPTVLCHSCLVLVSTVNLNLNSTPG